MKTYLKIIVAIVFVGFVMSCKKETEDPAPQVANQPLTLRLTPTIGDDDTLEFNTSFTTENNVRYTMSSFRYYMSNIRLVKSDGTEQSLGDKVFLVNPNTSDYSLGNVPVGEYKGIRFTLGLDNVTNHLDPTTYPLSNPLAIQSPAMHWSWNSGYIFMMLEGSCDTTATNNDVLTYGQYSKPMFFHIGTDALAKSIDVQNATFTVSESTTNVLKMHSDINRLFVGVDLKTENQSHTMGSVSLATKVANNFNSMFSIQ